MASAAAGCTLLLLLVITEYSQASQSPLLDKEERGQGIGTSAWTHISHDSGFTNNMAWNGETGLVVTEPYTTSFPSYSIREVLVDQFNSIYYYEERGTSYYIMCNSTNPNGSTWTKQTSSSVHHLLLNPQVADNALYAVLTDSIRVYNIKDGSEVAHQVICIDTHYTCTASYPIVNPVNNDVLLAVSVFNVTTEEDYMVLYSFDASLRLKWTSNWDNTSDINFGVVMGVTTSYLYVLVDGNIYLVNSTNGNRRPIEVSQFVSTIYMVIPAHEDAELLLLRYQNNTKHTVEWILIESGTESMTGTLLDQGTVLAADRFNFNSSSVLLSDGQDQIFMFQWDPHRKVMDMLWTDRIGSKVLNGPIIGPLAYLLYSNGQLVYLTAYDLVHRQSLWAVQLEDYDPTSSYLMSVGLDVIYVSGPILLHRVVSCSGHGQSFGPPLNNTCNCFANYYLNCTRYCDESVCHNGGTCSTNGTCTCQTLWQGETCNDPWLLITTSTIYGITVLIFFIMSICVLRAKKCCSKKEKRQSYLKQ